MAWIKGRAYPIIANAAEQGNEKAQKILDMQSGSNTTQESLDKAVDDFFDSFSSASETKDYSSDKLKSYQSVWEARKNGLEMDDWVKNYKGFDAKKTWEKAANDYDINSIKEERAYEARMKSQKANETSGVSKYVAEARKKYNPKAFGNFMKDIVEAKNDNDLTGIKIKMSQDYSGYVINDSEFDKLRKAISDKKVKLSQKKAAMNKFNSLEDEFLDILDEYNRADDIDQSGEDYRYGQEIEAKKYMLKKKVEQARKELLTDKDVADEINKQFATLFTRINSFD